MSRTPIQSNYVINKLKEMILFRQITNDALISETSLADSLGVSRTPIREALKILENEGVLSRLNGRIVVNYIDTSKSAELELIRSRLESLAAEFAARRVDSQGKRELLEALSELENYRGTNLFEMSQLNDNLHLTIAKVSKMDFLVEILLDIQTKLKLSQSVMHITTDRRSGSAEEHRQIIDLIVNHKAKAAGKLAESHVYLTYKLILSSVSKKEKQREYKISEIQ